MILPHLRTYGFRVFSHRLGVGLKLVNLLLFTALLLIHQGVFAAHPGWEFVQIKKRFLNDDAPTTGALSQEQAGGLREAAYSGPHEEEETGTQYFARESAIQILPAEEGDLAVYETIVRDDLEGQTMMAKRPLKLPIETNPYAASNVLAARHPLAYILPELQEVVAIREEPAILFMNPTGRAQIEQGNWIYIHHKDDDGNIWRIDQFDKQSKGIVKRMIFRDWKTTAEGLRVPDEVILRTFRFDERKPVVEIQFLNITERSAAPDQESGP